MSGRFNPLRNNKPSPSGQGSNRTHKRRERRKIARAAAASAKRRNNSGNKRNNSKRNKKTKKTKYKRRGNGFSLKRGFKAAAAGIGLGGPTNVGAVRDLGSNYGSADGLGLGNYGAAYTSCAVECRGGNNMGPECNTCLDAHPATGVVVHGSPGSSCEFGSWGDGSCRNSQNFGSNFGGRTRRRRRRRRRKKKYSRRRRKKKSSRRRRR